MTINSGKKKKNKHQSQKPEGKGPPICGCLVPSSYIMALLNLVPRVNNWLVVRTADQGVVMPGLFGLVWLVRLAPHFPQLLHSFQPLPSHRPPKKPSQFHYRPNRIVSVVSIIFWGIHKSIGIYLHITSMHGAYN